MTRAFGLILRMSICAATTGLAVLLLRRAFKRVAPRWIFYLMWGAVFVRMTVPILPAAPASIFNWIPAPTFPAPPRPGPAIWAVGAGLLLVYSAAVYLRTLRLLRRARRVDSRTTGMPESVPVYQSALFRTPVVCGLIRPRVILPERMKLSAGPEMRHVLSHELTHVLRRDNFWKTAAALAMCLHWFNPVLWACYWCFVSDMEASCDEKVVRESERDIRAEYASSLLDLASGRRGAFAGGLLSFGECALKERVKTIMRVRPTKASAAAVCLAAAAGLFMLFLTDPTPVDSPVVMTQPSVVKRGGTAPAQSRPPSAEPRGEVSAPAADPPAEAPAPPTAAASLIHPEETPFLPGNPPELSVSPGDARRILIYPADSPYGCAEVSRAADKLALIHALNQVDGAVLAPQSAASGRAARLKIDLLDGAVYEYRCYPNALSTGNNQYSAAALLEPLYTLIGRLTEQYPLGAAWLAEMDENRIDSVLFSRAGEDARFYSAETSGADREAVLEIAAALRGLEAVYVGTGRIPEEDALWNVRLKHDGGFYQILLGGGGTLSAETQGAADGLTYHLQNPAGIEAVLERRFSSAPKASPGGY